MINITQMKTWILLLCTILSINLNSQENFKTEDTYDCDQLIKKHLDQLTEELSLRNFTKVDSILHLWESNCGSNETSQRLKITSNINQKKCIENDLKIYLENGFVSQYLYRINTSRKIDYGFRYSDNKSYFGYIPLRHHIDSLVQKISQNNLKNYSLSKDEQLISLLFSENIEEFKSAVKRNENRSTLIALYLQKGYSEYFMSVINFNVYLGVFSPLSKNDIFSKSPMLGLSLSSPLGYKMILEICFKLRFNINDESFKYYESNQINEVNSPSSAFFGIQAGYKLLQSKHLIIIPKAGFGVESVSTGLETTSKNSDDSFSAIETLHLSIGMSALSPLMYKGYIGFGINYHYCPYHLDKNLLTQIDNHLISAEMFYRF